MDKYINLAALGKVLLASLLAGVGLVSIFGFGMVGLSEYQGRMQAGQHAGGQRGGPAWLAVAGACFLIVAAGIALGIYTIAS